MKTVEDVMRVRLRASLMLSLISPLRPDFGFFFRFSRMRSKTTTVSVREYPAKVRKAVTTRRVISLCRRKRTPSTTRTS
jgi:hypothetical protein